jgi:hypothetical protein
MGGGWTCRLAGIAAIVVTVFAAGEVEAASARLPGGVGAWRVSGSMVSIRQNHQPGVRLADGRVLVLSESALETVSEIYDPRSRGWTAGPSLEQRSERDWTSVALADGGALLIGQRACALAGPFKCIPTNVTYRLARGGSTWTLAAPMSVARGLPAAVLLSDGRVLVAGGFGDSCPTTFGFGYSCQALASAEIYDPASNRWAATTPLPSPRGAANAARMSDGTVLLIGGDEPGRALSYDPRTARWATLARSTFGRTGAKLIALPGDRALALGGGLGPGFYGSRGTLAVLRRIGFCESSPELYTRATNRWTPAPPFPEGSLACSTSAAVVRGGQILYEAAGALYLLDSHQLCWSAAAARDDGQRGELVGLSDGTALDFGGLERSSGPVLSAETYTPGGPICLASARAQATMFSQLLPSGAAAGLGSILEIGYPLRFRMPGPGRVVIEWYLRQLGAALQRKSALVAVARAKSPRGRPVNLVMKLTAVGHEAIERSPSVRLTAFARFVPVRGRPVTAARSFRLGGEAPR